MKVTINAVHFKADSKLEEFITNKIEKLCGKLDDAQGADVGPLVEHVRGESVPQNMRTLLL